MEVSSLHFQGEKAGRGDSELVAFDRQVRGPFPSQSLVVVGGLEGEREPFPATLHYLDSIYGWIKLNIGQDSLKEKNLSVEPSTCHHCNKGVTHRSAGKSPGFISWPCHMTRGQGYQRLPPHMERISGHRAQQLLLLPPISFFILTHACVLLEMENHQPRSAATIQVMNSTFARSLGKPARPETKAEHPSVPTSRLWRCSFSQLVETCQRLISQHYQCFPKKIYLVSSKPVPPQQSSYPLV